MDDKNKVKVLLVEDNPADQRLVEIYLQESTMIAPEPVKVAELKKGLLQLEEGDFDIVLLDLTLPDSSGFATIKTMLEEFPEQTVIVMTGLEDKAVALNSVKAGAQDFIVKGQFDSNLLSRTITYAIERHQLQMKLENYAKAIKRNEQKLLEAQRMARIGNWELDIVTNQMVWSDEVYRILGVEEGAVIPTLQEYLKHVKKEDVAEVKAAINRTMEKDQPYHVEYTLELPGGIVKNIANAGQIQVSRKSGGLSLSGTIQDISAFRAGGNTSGLELKKRLQEVLQTMEGGDEAAATATIKDLLATL